jgi:hypothetical protein
VAVRHVCHAHAPWWCIVRVVCRGDTSWLCVVPGDVSFTVHCQPLPSGVVSHCVVAAGLPIGEGVT